MRIFLILLLSITTHIAEARMYQWIESNTGTTQLSGTPPTWYRSSTDGPRVFVFEKGHLIDDTAVAVPDNVRQRMREEAFILAEEDRQKAKARIAKAKETREKLIKIKPDDVSKEVQIEEASEESLIADPTEFLFAEDTQEDEVQPEFTDKSLEELKAMIIEWEAQQTENARQVLD